MNLRQPYEQLIADKLRQLRAPDENASWQQMKQLLDDDEDTKGGGRRRPPGNNGLWRLGILAIVLTASFWLYVEKTPSPGNSLSKNNKAITPQAESKSNEANKNNSNNQKAAIDNTTTLTNSEANNTTAANNTVSSSANKTNAADNAAVIAKNNTAKTNKGNNDHSITVVSSEGAGYIANTAIAPLKHGSEKNNGHNTINNNKSTGSSANKPGILTAIDLSPAQKNKSGKLLAETNTVNDDIAAGLAANRVNDKGYNTGARLTTTQLHNQKVKEGNDRTRKSNNTIFGDDASFTNAENNNEVAANNFGAANQTSSSKEKTWFEKISGLRIEDPIPSFNTSLAAGDSVVDHRDVSHLLNKETQKDIAKAKRDKEIAVLDKQDKKFHLNLSNLFKPFSMRIDAEPWWAAGIALNAPVTVNAQNRFNYNMNAKSATLTDYIPSPYLQFHLNNYVYFQTELNFIMPQYTPQLLVYRQSNDISAQMAGSSQQKSVYVQKMYYFNWPVSLHYSPINNLFFSGGIQFSSFQSGLATIEEKQYPTALGVDHPSNINSTTLKFKDDSIAAKIAPNEWRWQVGAEYYINRFSIGMRYNQSFKNAINTTVLTGMAPTVSRNQSLLFFVRYNLFESRQKNSVPKNQ